MHWFLHVLVYVLKQYTVLPAAEGGRKRLHAVATATGKERFVVVVVVVVMPQPSDCHQGRKEKK